MKASEHRLLAFLVTVGFFLGVVGVYQDSSPKGLLGVILLLMAILFKQLIADLRR